MLNNWPILLLIALFLAAAGGVWAAGIRLSTATDILAERYGLGEALGGVVLLAIVTNLPEVAITASGAWRQDLSVAVGNILGGIAIQTVVLVVLDVIGLKKQAPLSERAASAALVLEGVLVIAVLSVTIMGTQLPADLIYARVTPAGAMILVLWVMGLWLINKGRALPEPDGADDSDEDPKPKKEHKIGIGRACIEFGICSVITLVCGVLLEQSGEAIAKQFGISGVIFGATFLAAATALPEVSTGLAAVKLGDYKMAVSDVLGGNAFLPVLFLPATIMSGHAVLPLAQKTDIYLSALGILLTAVYMTGLIFRPTQQIARMGIDSFAVLVLYVVGMAGLAAMPSG